MKKFNRYDVDVDYINMEAFADKLFGALKAKLETIRQEDLNVSAYMQHTENFNDKYVHGTAERFASIINDKLGALIYDWERWVQLEAYAAEKHITEQEFDKLLDQYSDECANKI